MKYTIYFSLLISIFLYTSLILPQVLDDGLSGLSVPGFKHLSAEDGLSQNGAFAIAQDRKGFIWIGTKNGLNKYDGYSFKVYTQNIYDSTTLSNNYISNLFEDRSGNLWIVTNSGEIDLMNGSTEIFYKLPFIIPYVTSMIEDEDGCIWIGTFRSGLFRIGKNDTTSSGYSAVNFKNSPNDPATISNNNAISLAADKDGTVWIGTLTGLDKYNINSGTGFDHYDLQGTVSSILINNDSTIWLGTTQGLALLNKITGELIPYPCKRDNVMNGSGGISEIKKDNNGTLWMRTQSGLLLFDPETKTYNFSYAAQMPAQARIFIDTAGDVWIGTSYGIYVHFPESNRFKSFPNAKFEKQFGSHLSTMSILADSKNNLWFGSLNCIYKWDRNSDQMTTYTDPRNINAFGSTGATAISDDSNGNLWFATVQGLFRLNTTTNIIKPYRFNQDSDQAVYGIFADPEGGIRIVTNKYFGVLTDINKGKFKNYRFKSDPVPGSETGASVIYQDGENNYWFTSDIGLIKFNPKSKKFTYYKNDPTDPGSINSDNVKCICPDPADPSGKLWVGTAGGGLNLFDKRTEKFTHITVDEGLPNNVVYGILSDEKDYLWLTTNRGLSRYDISEKHFTNYDVHDGLQNNEFNTGAFFKSKAGELFFGGISGINYFYPQDAALNKSTPGVVFTEFSFFNKPVSVKDNDPVLHKIISETGLVEIPYSRNILSFEFALLDYYAPSKNRFAYMLEGFNKEWISLGTKNEVMLTGLDPGTYILKVKGSNSDGIWTNNYASLTIVITPPWWKTWWAYTLYIFIFLTGIYWIRKYELKRVQLKNALELEKVETDTLRSLDQIKSRFFANISHEFRTPLTLILGQIESIMSSDVDIQKKSKLQVANRNARRLLTLINQLLDLSKIESGNVEFDAEQQNIVSFTKSLFYSFESLAESKKINLSFECTSDKVPLIFDPDKMEKILYNLLSNAFKFTPPGGEIKASVVTENISRVEIRIKDTGIGIPGDRLGKIFDRFYQVDSSQTREYEGTGIGLALTKELVELHKGKITVTSKENEGTEFILDFPQGDLISNLHDQPPQSANFDNPDFDQNHIAENSGEESDSLQNLADVNNKREIILIVEDNADVRAYIREYLERDYRVLEAGNGEEGIRRAESSIPDLIITDVMMPKMNGYQFSSKIRNEEKTSHIPIIMLTAKGALDDKIEGLETGIDAYITKPFSVKELKVRVKNLIGQRKQLRKRFSRATFIKPSEVSAISSDQLFLEKTIAVIEKHYGDEKFNIDLLADQVNMSRSQLNRKLNALIDQPAVKLIKSFRLQRAADLLEKNAGSVSEICFGVGFNDHGYFSKAFKKQFGCTPTEYRGNGKAAKNSGSD